MDICKPDLCTNCKACVQICPKQCIYFEEDECGATIVKIDKEKCIECGMCKRVCQVNSEMIKNHPLACYAAYRKEMLPRLNSASGGVASVLYERFIKKYGEGNAYVVGVDFDEDMYAKAILTNDSKVIERFKGSKYVEADWSGIYISIGEKLKQDKYVLCVATPCKISGCLHFLKQKNISTEKLITVDLLCHGVSEEKFFMDQLASIQKKISSGINNVSFRSNKSYRNFRFVCYSDDKVVFNQSAYGNAYFFGFLKGITLRESCYSCQYSSKERIGDITIGDYIGLGNYKALEKELVGKKNVSMVLINSDKGQALFEKCEEELIVVRRPFEEAVLGGASLRQPFERHVARDKFLKFYKETQNFKYSILKSCKWEFIKPVIKGGIKNAIVKIVAWLNLDADKLCKKMGW